MATTYTCRVNVGNSVLHIRNGPSLANRIIGIHANGTVFTADRIQNDWYYSPAHGGWSAGWWMEVQAHTSNASTPAAPAVPPAPKMSEDDQMDKFLEYASKDATIDGMMNKGIEGIHGAPYQFMPNVDMRITEESSLGYVYSQKMVARMPLLLMTPGRVNFGRDYASTEEGALAIQKLLEVDKTDTDISKLIKRGTRYYTFDFNYADYYEYVDGMCAASAHFLGIGNVPIKIDGEYVKAAEISWAKAGSNAMKTVLSSREYIAFYVDSASQTSENFTNETTESQLASTVNSFSDTGREIQFLLGSTAGGDFVNEGNAKLDDVLNSVDDVIDKYLRKNQLFKDITNNFATIAVGGKLIFPEIWSDSSFSNDYDISIKLRTPHGDKVSWFMNICVPLCHLICMAAPLQTDKRIKSEANPNGYVSPFLVRAFHKGLFNCNMGIITSLSISKGKERAWTLDGLPTEVDVSMQIKDLYQMLTLTNYKDTGQFVNNLSLVDYICNSVGININEPDFNKMITLYMILKKNKFSNMLPDTYYDIEQWILNQRITVMDKITHALGWIG